MTEKNDDRRILEEEVMGVVPAIGLSDKGAPLQCGLVFATNVMIVAFFKSKTAQIAGALRNPDYHIMKKAWAQYVHKPTAPILKEYKCYIIPYSDVTHIGAVETGRIRKRSILSIHTAQQQYIFNINASRWTLDKDVSLLLRHAGIGFSKGE